MVDALAAKLGPCQGTKVEVAGHTDLTGVAANNQRLSEERANTVVAALVAKGVPTARLTPKGYGQTKPVMPGTTAEANTKNRRIEFSVMAAN
jgi:outer membrane protein OmpA-like peptidoglycan-associated protein